MITPTPCTLEPKPQPVPWLTASAMIFQSQPHSLRSGPGTLQNSFPEEDRRSYVYTAEERLKWAPQDLWDLTRKKTPGSKISSLLWAVPSLRSHRCFLWGVGQSHHSRQIPCGSFAYRCQRSLKIGPTLSSRKHKPWNVFTGEGRQPSKEGGSNQPVRGSLRRAGNRSAGRIQETGYDLIPLFICLVHLRSTPSSLDFGVSIFKIGVLDWMVNVRAAPCSLELHGIITYPYHSDNYNQIDIANMDWAHTVRNYDR